MLRRTILQFSWAAPQPKHLDTHGSLIRSHRGETSTLPARPFVINVIKSWAGLGRSHRRGRHPPLGVRLDPLLGQAVTDGRQGANCPWPLERKPELSTNVADVGLQEA